jgi:hypothetical protein
MDDRRVEYQRRAERDGARIRTGAKKKGGIMGGGKSFGVRRRDSGGELMG